MGKVVKILPSLHHAGSDAQGQERSRSSNRPATLDLLEIQRSFGNAAAMVVVLRHAPAGRTPVDGATTPASAHTAGREEVITSVQRKVGFEFQTSNHFVGRPKGSDSNPQLRRPKWEEYEVVGEKNLAYQSDSGSFKVEGDQGPSDAEYDIEFITGPNDSKSEAILAAEEASELAVKMRTSVGRNGYLKVRSGESMGRGKWQRNAWMKIDDPDFKAKPQGSVGISLKNIGDFLSSAPGSGSDRARAKRGMETARKLAEGASSEQQQLGDSAKGLLQMLSYYLEAAAVRPSRATRGSREDDVFGSRFDREHFPGGPVELYSGGPKANFFVMARTDFRSMFLSLSGDEQGQVRRILDRPEDLERILKCRPNEPVFTGPYRADPDVVAQMKDEDRLAYRIEWLRADSGNFHPVVLGGPTIRAWLKSITTGEESVNGVTVYRNRDLLSAPPGWGSHESKDNERFPSGDEVRDEFIYGMGAYPMDSDLVVLELRTLCSDFLIGEDLEATYWPWMANSVINKYMGAAQLR